MPFPWLTRVLTAAVLISDLNSPPMADPAAQLQIGFNPAVGVTQKFRVTYRQYYRRDAPALPIGTFAVTYTLAVTPTREKDGYRLRLLVSDVERPASDSMNMVVAAALMLDGFPFDMLVDARGFLTEVSDWPDVQRELVRRADAFPPAWRGVARSVPDGHTAQQVAWHLARAIDAMNFARSYTAFATRHGASTIKWHGGLLVNVTVEPPDETGNSAIGWSLPAGAPPEGEGHGVIRGDGFVAPLTMSMSRDGGRTHEVHEINPTPVH